VTSTIQDAVTWLEKRIPMALAASWDNTGLLLGDARSPLRKVATCLTVTPETTLEAVSMGADLLISHHPLFFRGAKSLVSRNPQESMILDLIRANVAVFSPHTAWDNAPGGINDQLAALVGIRQVKALRVAAKPSGQIKLVVFVPQTSREAVAQALFEAGAGVIGAYQGCSFRVLGTGTFFGTETTNPTVGKRGQFEEVAEERLELVCPKAKLAAVIAALRKTHPYEEPAFDLFPMESVPQPLFGEGRVGQLDAGQTLGELARNLGKSLKAGSVQIVGNPHQTGSIVAMACGAAGEFLQDALRQKADFFITGELSYHHALQAKAEGLGVIVLGHHASEHFAMEALATELSQAFPGIQARFVSAESDPFQTI